MPSRMAEVKQRLEKNETHPTQESTSIHNIQDTVGAVAWLTAAA